MTKTKTAKKTTQPERTPLLEFRFAHPGQLDSAALLKVCERGNPLRTRPESHTYPFDRLILSEAPATIILGEVGSGRSTLLRAVDGWLARQSTIQWARAECDLLDASALYGLLGNMTSGWDGVAKHLTAQGGKGSRRLLILEHLNHYDPESITKIAARLRALFETRHELELLIFDNEPLLYAPDGDDSSSEIATVSDVYRLPWWTADQIRRPVGKPEIAESAAAACIEWTGGQPVLTQAFLAEASRKHPGTVSDIAKDLQHAGERVLARPPAQQVHWQAELRKLCQKAERLAVVRALVAGQCFKHHHLPADADPLFLAGWMCWTPVREWHMPLCHRAWAREVVLGG